MEDGLFSAAQMQDRLVLMAGEPQGTPRYQVSAIAAQHAVDFLALKPHLFLPVVGGDKRSQIWVRQSGITAAQMDYYISEAMADMKAPSDAGFIMKMFWPFILSAIISAIVKAAINWAFFSHDARQVYRSCFALKEQRQQEAR